MLFAVKEISNDALVHFIHKSAITCIANLNSLHKSTGKMCTNRGQNGKICPFFERIYRWLLTTTMTYDKNKMSIYLFFNLKRKRMIKGEALCTNSSIGKH